MNHATMVTFVPIFRNAALRTFYMKGGEQALVAVAQLSSAISKAAIQTSELQSVDPQFRLGHLGGDQFWR